jgi:hypothetical protein
MNVQARSRIEPIKGLQIVVGVRVWASPQTEVRFETGLGKMVSVPQTDIDDRTRVSPIAFVHPKKDHRRNWIDEIVDDQ